MVWLKGRSYLLSKDFNVEITLNSFLMLARFLSLAKFKIIRSVASLTLCEDPIFL